MSEVNESERLQTLLDYYRNKSSQLELDYVQYQITAQGLIQDLQSQLADATGTGEGNGEDADQPADSDAAKPTASTKG